MPPASVLSPLATPFFPSGDEYVQDSFSSIYINGMPTLVYAGEKPEHEVLHNIADEAIDEAFPPSAEEAAELDAMDDFIDTLVDLSFLEDREEKARTTFDFVQKRWETRREEGLRGKPHPVRNYGIDADTGRSESARHVARHVTSLVKLNYFGKVHQDFLETRPRAKYVGKYNSISGHKGMHSYRKPIQQPRKAN